MKTTKALLSVAAVMIVFAPRADVKADDLAAAAAKASKLVNRPIAASPHALEEFPWLLRGSSPPIATSHTAQTTQIYPNNLAATAAKASALVNRPIVASPHGLEEFPSFLQGYPPQVAVKYPAQPLRTYPDNLGAAAAKASALVNRPVVASPHGLEEFPWLLRGISPQIEPNQLASTNGIHSRNPAVDPAKASPSINRPIAHGTHRGDYP